SIPGVGRADVWVFDAASGGDSGSMSGTPLTILTFFADTPRALAVTPDGSKVYVAAFNSGNATASSFAPTLPGLSNPLPPYGPSTQLPFNVKTNSRGEEQPPTPVIVKYDGTHWRDEKGGIRDAEMMFTMPDRDVFTINPNANPPVALNGSTDFYAHVG